ncbi:MAG TPA: RHS repeat-associated core domain-containing protein [Sedimentisphaerales bacterium]|nr:RHS repeat-associated core domain-containing protein [Sedimentisphaerales bacterium]
MRTEDATIRGTVPTALAAACDCELSFTTGGDAEWFAQSVEYYADNDAAQSRTIGSGQETWMQTTVVGPGNVSFRYKMSSVSGDALAFYVDENFKASWSQGSTWPWTGNFAVPSGTHTLKWKYYKYSGSTAGSCWIDAIQWSGGVPGSGGGADWQQITYTYDPSGRRIAKDVDGEVTKYRTACPELAERDGDQCIAEYDGNDVLLRKYIHGPSIDEPRSASLRAGSFCMVEAAGGYAGTYYYHFDALGSVVALSDAAGDTVQVYEYDVYGQVAASDPNHPNRFLFTGREFDTETGLYYYRARYYNPTLGRFLQTDPIGYGDGINWYRYCRNNPACCTDPSGSVLVSYTLKSNYLPDGSIDWMCALIFTATIVNDEGETVTLEPMFFQQIEDWVRFMASERAIEMGIVPTDSISNVWTISDFQGSWDAGINAGARLTYWTVTALLDLGIFTTNDVATLVENDVRIMNWSGLAYTGMHYNHQRTDQGFRYIWWSSYPRLPQDPDLVETWMYWASPLATLAHELRHALDIATGALPPPTPEGVADPYFDLREGRAIWSQNQTQRAIRELNPKWYDFLWAFLSPIREGEIPVIP